jgi:hypothetical protein
MPDWKVYSCILMNQTWNLFEESIDDIWKSNKIITLRKKILDWKCPECMLMCWIFKSKQTYEK